MIVAIDLDSGNRYLDGIKRAWHAEGFLTDAELRAILGYNYRNAFDIIDL
jgi:hypothetical protein